MRNTLPNSGKFLSSTISFFLILIWIGNDHIGKFLFHNEFTGKLSDITGLIVFPFLLTNLAFIISFRKLPEGILFFLANLSIVTLFFIINWSQDWSYWIYAKFFGNQNGVADKTDLLCIPFTIFANIYLYKKYSIQDIPVTLRIKVLNVIAIILSTIAFMNTSNP